jgi:hypothetical protein
MINPCHGQSDRPRDLLRGLVGGSPSAGADELEAEAAAAGDVATARRLYETLHARHANRNPGIRAALWLGRYHYGAGAVEDALRYFEAARSAAADPELKAEAVFWCEQARLLAGREPLRSAGEESTQGYWSTLRSLVRVDRLVRQGRIDEAETSLEALQQETFRLGFCGLLLVRWGDVLRLRGSKPSEIADLRPLVETTCVLPERLHLERPLVGTADAQPLGELWSLEFGAHVDIEDAEAQREELRVKGLETRIDETGRTGRTVYQVRLGDFSSRAEVDSFASQMTWDAAAQPRVVRLR